MQVGHLILCRLQIVRQCASRASDRDAVENREKVMDYPHHKMRRRRSESVIGNVSAGRLPIMPRLNRVSRA